MPGQNLFRSLLRRPVSGPSPGKVTVDAIGREDERISRGNGENFNLKRRQLQAYNAGAQQQRHSRLSAGEAATKQDTLDIPHTQPRNLPAGHAKRRDAHGDAARSA